MTIDVSRIPEHLETERLILRRWCEADLLPFADINADPHVMEHFPSCLSTSESEQVMQKIIAHFARHKLGLWAVEVKSSREFIGFVGLQVPSFEAHFTPCVEVGWRLAKQHWGQGYAPEAALEAMRDGFERAGLTEIVSMTTTTNKNTKHTQHKIGMSRNPDDDFDHPRIADGHLLQRHVLYRLPRARWSLTSG